ncbi:protein kinase domain-containing protein [Actinoplanes sp. CA-252034]|uniref:protein kinase domain-containing protein n=1 Tax=Actinoplanes sp. CA-252034 TaxID=3239906 RepID=UPI003D97490B
MTPDHAPDTAASTDASAATPLPAYVPPPVPDHGLWIGPEHAPAAYERLEHVGGGVEGTVYRARFAGRGRASTRLVAVKEYRCPAGADRSWPHDGTWPHLDDQVGLLRGLPDNPHLVRVRELFLGGAGTARNPARVFRTPYLVMEWIDGTPPTAVLGARPVPVAERTGWIRDLAEAIDLLHSVTRTENNPIVHGDIKPGNCLVTADRGLVLVDTGAVTRLGSDATRRGLCTPPYAAPEVLAAPERPRTAASDLFSLGAVAYHLLVGEPPPSAEDPGYHAEVDRRLAVATWAEAAGDAGVRELISRYLSPDPVFRAGLGPVAWSNRIAAALAGEPALPVGRARRHVGRALTAAAMTTVLGAAVWTLWPDGSRQRQPAALAGPGASSAGPGGSSVGPGGSSVGPGSVGPGAVEDVDFAVFGRKWADFPATAGPETLSISPPAGADRFKHLWGFWSPTRHCASTVEFDVEVKPVGDNYGIAVAPRSTLPDDQPQGYSVQYEWQTADVSSRPGPVVRPVELPGGAWSVDVAPTPAPDLRTRRHVAVTSVGSTMTVSVDGRELAAYDLPEVECGGVAVRAWGADATFTGVRVTGS